MSYLALFLAHLGLTVIAARPGASSSRRILAATVSFLVPIVGLGLASLVRRARGGGVAPEPERALVGARGLTPADVRMVGELAPLLDRLMSTDAGERLAALVMLSRSADADAVRMLRWAVEHGSSEVVLDAALTLEELDLRREQRLEAASARFRAEPGFDSAMAAADAAASGVLDGLADPVTVPALAEQARSSYLYALSVDASRASEIEERMARLELAASRPLEALELIRQLGERLGVAAAFGLAPLRDAAAFAARRFDLVSSEAAGEIELQDHPVFVRLASVLDRSREVDRRTVRGFQPVARPTFDGALAAVKIATGVWRFDAR
jgi:hypothetical protein